MPYDLRNLGPSFQQHVEWTGPSDIATQLLPGWTTLSSAAGTMRSTQAICGRSYRPYKTMVSSSTARGVCGASQSWTTLATRYRWQACCHSLPTWSPSRSFPAFLSSRSCRHFWGWSTSTGDSCPASPGHCGSSQTSCGRKGLERVVSGDGHRFCSSRASTAVCHSPSPPYCRSRFVSSVDASAMHMGACLQQQVRSRKDWQPFGFFSKKLEAAQQKYSDISST
jgi:hypothetical protein